jgi:superfamily II DNA or RNA helicase
MAFEPRNRVLDFILDNTPKTENTMILVSRIEKHLKPITDYLTTKYPDRKLKVIYGATDALDREKIRADLENETGTILLATYQTVGAGFNVKNLHQIIFFSSYKAKIKVLQAIGRGLRVHKSKQQLIVWDVIDDLSYVTRNKTVHLNHLAKHFIERRKYYKRSGFKYQNKIIQLESINTNKLI